MANIKDLKNTDKVRLLAPAITPSGGTILAGVYEVSDLSPEILETAHWKVASDEKTETKGKKVEGPNATSTKHEIKPEA